MTHAEERLMIKLKEIATELDNLWHSMHDTGIWIEKKKTAKTELESSLDDIFISIQMYRNYIEKLKNECQTGKCEYCKSVIENVRKLELSRPHRNSLEIDRAYNLIESLAKASKQIEEDFDATLDTFVDNEKEKVLKQIKELNREKTSIERTLNKLQEKRTGSSERLERQRDFAEALDEVKSKSIGSKSTFVSFFIAWIFIILIINFFKFFF